MYFLSSSFILTINDLISFKFHSVLLALILSLTMSFASYITLTSYIGFSRHFKVPFCWFRLNSREVIEIPFGRRMLGYNAMCILHPVRIAPQVKLTARFLPTEGVHNKNGYLVVSCNEGLNQMCSTVLEYWAGRGMLQIFFALMTRAYLDTHGERHEILLLQDIVKYMLLAYGFIYAVSLSQINNIK